MKEMMLICVLIFSLACAAPAPEGDETGEADVTTAELEEGEDLEEEELEIPPEGSIPLSEIIASLEVGTHIAITEVEFENGVWEIEYVVGAEEYELKIDPMTGKALSDEPEKSDDD